MRQRACSSFQTNAARESEAGRAPAGGCGMGQRTSSSGGITARFPSPRMTAARRPETGAQILAPTPCNFEKAKRKSLVRLLLTDGNVVKIMSVLTRPTETERAGWGCSQLRTRLSTKFPANREINREFCRIRPSVAIFGSNQRADSIASSRIPCATEQGISKRVSGKIFQGTGNRHADIRPQQR
jgi:hypothetical protein